MNTFFRIAHSSGACEELVNLLEVQFVSCRFQLNPSSQDEEDYKMRITFLNGARQEVWISKESYDAFVKALCDVNAIE